MSSNTLPLTKVISALRKNLEDAMEQGVDAALQFNVNEIEVELKTVIEDNDVVKGGFNFHVLKFDGTAGKKETESHTLKIKLTPVLNDDDENKEGSKNTNLKVSGSPKRVIK